MDRYVLRREEHWIQCFAKATIAITWFGSYVERAEVDSVTYYNTSLSGKANQYPTLIPSFWKVPTATVWWRFRRISQKRWSSRSRDLMEVCWIKKCMDESGHTILVTKTTRLLIPLVSLYSVWLQRVAPLHNHDTCENLIFGTFRCVFWCLDFVADLSNQRGTQNSVSKLV